MWCSAEHGFSPYPKLMHYGAFHGIRLCKARELVHRLQEERLQIVQEAAQYIIHYKRQEQKSRDRLNKWDEHRTMDIECTGHTLTPRYMEQDLLQKVMLDDRECAGAHSLVLQATHHFHHMWRHALHVLGKSFFMSPECPSPVDWDTLKGSLHTNSYGGEISDDNSDSTNDSSETEDEDFTLTTDEGGDEQEDAYIDDCDVLV